MELQNITLEKKEGIARLTINRPPVNIINYETIQEINAVLEELAKDEETKVLLVYGSGNRAFSAGVEIRDHLGEMAARMLKVFGRMFQLLRNLGKPSIAVVNGVALGGGCELAVGCDMAIASEKAQFGVPEITLGGLASAAVAYFPRILGEKKAFELIMLGEIISAREAERIGLVNKVVAEEELEKTAEELAAKFLEKSGIGVKLCRDVFYQCADTAQLTEALEKGAELGIKTWETEDSQEGLKSFLEKRAPVWKNK
ncbi:MAG: enoyl-CoA hydratase-related protein [Dehalococcoidales bacterium]|nr:enoyl-CoA hydratase-related protein [Dehalococcoidales bacterium]